MSVQTGRVGQRSPVSSRAGGEQAPKPAGRTDMNGVGMRMLPALLFLFALVRGVWGRDFVVTEMGAGPDDGKDDTPAVQAAIDECQVNPGSRLVFPPGRYDFFVGRNPKSKDISMFFEGCEDLSIVGDAAELVFHGLTRGLFFRDCRTQGWLERPKGNIHVSGWKEDRIWWLSARR